MESICREIDCALEKQEEPTFFLLLWNLPGTEVVETISGSSSGQAELSSAQHWFPSTLSPKL